MDKVLYIYEGKEIMSEDSGEMLVVVGRGAGIDTIYCDVYEYDELDEQHKQLYHEDYGYTYKRQDLYTVYELAKKAKVQQVYWDEFEAEDESDAKGEHR